MWFLELVVVWEVIRGCLVCRFSSEFQRLLASKQWKMWVPLSGKSSYFHCRRLTMVDRGWSSSLSSCSSYFGREQWWFVWSVRSLRRRLCLLWVFGMSRSGVAFAVICVRTSFVCGFRSWPYWKSCWSSEWFSLSLPTVLSIWLSGRCCFQNSLASAVLVFSISFLRVWCLAQLSCGRFWESSLNGQCNSRFGTPIWGCVLVSYRSVAEVN